MATSTNNSNLKGISILIIATLFLATQDAITKHLTATMSVFQIVSVRFFFFSIFATLFAAKRVGLREGFRTAHPWLQILRGILISTEIAIFAYALRFLGLAEMHALVACFPLLATALSVPILGETVGWRRWFAVFIGFIGTLIIIRPGAGVFDPYALLAILAALMFALYNILTRKVSRKDSFETSILYFGVVGFLVSMLATPFVWETPSQNEAFWLLAISLAAIIGHISLIKALELVPAVILQPFNYFVLIWAMILSYLVYNEILDWITILGAAIVVASGIFIARREYKLQAIDSND